MVINSVDDLLGWWLLDWCWNGDTVGLVVVLLICSKLSGDGDLLGLVVAGLVLYW